MAELVSRTTEDDDLIFRFLRAASNRVDVDPGRIPINSREARAAISWLNGLVGRIKDDGSLE